MVLRIKIPPGQPVPGHWKFYMEIRLKNKKKSQKCQKGTLWHVSVVAHYII